MEKSANFELPYANISEQYTDARMLLREALKATGRVYLSSRFDDHFFTLSNIEQLNLLQSLESWSKFILEFVASGGNHKKTRDVLRYYLSRLNFTAPDSFLNQIQDGDVVEIYGSDSRRLFANPELFDFSSYAPDVMFSGQWWNLYERDPMISQKLQEIGYETFMGLNKTTVQPDIPVHTVKELRSQGRYTSEVQIRAVAPITIGTTVVAVAALETFRLLEGVKPSHIHS
ncbi:hypothetical protein [Bdellovibrio sp. HCB274]|uniref:hypothetical protein n=1 Tax=Bdellovibrio sp. HCB274 TaxID=3394361 RepID=UPI0039B38316